MIEQLFEQYKRLTGGDVGAAATLVLAHVNSDKSGMPDSSMATVSEAAGILHLAPNTIKKLCREGQLVSVRLNRVYRIRRDSIDAYMRQGLKPLASSMDMHRNRGRA